MTAFCGKYVVLMELLYRDQELNQWCRDYSSYAENTTHCELRDLIYDDFMKEAYELEFMPKALAWKPYNAYSLQAALAGTKVDLMYGIFVEIRSDYGSNGSLIHQAIAGGNLYRLMDAWLRCENRRAHAQVKQEEKAVSAGRPYTLDFIKAQGHRIRERKPGAMTSGLDTSLHKWWLWVQLDEDRQWFLTVFIFEDGSVDKYSLNRETASDDHYEFKAEAEIRNQLYASGDENRYLHEILIRFVKEHGGKALLNLIRPCVTAQFHYD